MFPSLILVTNQVFREIDAAHAFDTGHLAMCATSEQCSWLFAVVCLKSVAAADCLFTERLTWDLEGLWGF